MVQWTWFLRSTLCWLVSWRAWAEWGLLSWSWWLIVIHQRHGCGSSLSTRSWHYATVDRGSHLISHSIWQTRHLQGHVWVLWLVVRISLVYQLFSIDFLVVVVCRVYCWLLWWVTPFYWHLSRVWSFLNPQVWLPDILNRLVELGGCWLKYSMAQGSLLLSHPICTKWSLWGPFISLHARLRRIIRCKLTWGRNRALKIIWVQVCFELKLVSQG